MTDMLSQSLKDSEDGFNRMKNKFYATNQQYNAIWFPHLQKFPCRREFRRPCRKFPEKFIFRRLKQQRVACHFPVPEL